MIRTSRVENLRKDEKDMKRFILLLGLFSVFFSLGPMTAEIQAQPYPNRPIQVVIPSTPGAGVDLLGRLVGEEMGKVLKTQVLMVNKPGASMTLGTDAVVRSKKDGYTLLYAATSAIVYARVPVPDVVPYDPVKDLEPLGFHVWNPLIIGVNEAAPWKTFNELIDYAKQNPGKVRVSMHSIGSIDHFNLEIIKSSTGAQLNMVPFKGPAEATTALLGGHVDVAALALTMALPHLQTGKMKILLISRKWPGLPNMPTFGELGYRPDLGAAWFAFYAPAGIPEDVKDILVQAFEKAVKNPELKAKVEKLGFTVDYKPPTELRKIMIEDFESAMALATKLGLRK
jgi:tripartite-type tricarboxylate transporter receptor subunit TctC